MSAIQKFLWNQTKISKESLWLMVAMYQKNLQKEFYMEGKRILFVALRKNMKKIITSWQFHLYNTRMLIELNFRNLKMFYNLITSLPRSIDGYLANYTYSLSSYLIS